MSAKQVIVALSGGVDSAVSALLLKQQRYNVSGVFMKNWDERDESGFCEGEKEWEKVQRIGDVLQINVQRVDFVREYWNEVFNAVIDGYSQNRTPNPDILCNENIKFGALYKKLSNDFGSDFLMATGHYCGVRREATGVVSLLRGLDPLKDQSYFLCKTSRERLMNVIFPLANMYKKDVKSVAASNAALKHLAIQQESMGICFIGKRRKFDDFLAKYIPSKSGLFRSLENNTALGEHAGSFRYTIGQKAKISGMEQKWYVARKDAPSNTVFVVPTQNHPSLWLQQVKIDFGQFNDIPQRVRAQIRHGGTAELATCLQLEGSIYELRLDTPIRGIATGQYVALYDAEKNSVCIAGGEIVD